MLSAHDTSILAALFDAEASPRSGVAIDDTLPAYPQVSDSEYAALRRQEAAIVRPLNQAHPSDEAIREAVRLLDELIVNHPELPSAYMNRAQTIRLRCPVAHMFSRDHTDDSAAIVDSLGRAIHLTTPSLPKTAESSYQASVLASSHTHRGFLLLKAADLARRGKTIHGATSVLQRCTAEELEDLASRDFSHGGFYGSQVAQQMSVKTNPYAKMCGAIVKEAMRKEIADSNPRIDVFSGLAA